MLVHHPTGEALAQVVLMLAAIWWMYGAFAWLTNAVPPDRTALRLPLLAGMLAFFAISLTIPTAFTEDGVVFACAYLVVIAVHTVLYTQSASWTVAGRLELRANEPGRWGAHSGRGDHRRDGRVRLLDPRRR